MAIGPLPPIGTAGSAAANPVATGAVAKPAAPGFGEQLRKGLEAVSDLERQADSVAQSVATGGPAQIHELMAATTKSTVATELLVQVRNRAVEAYQEIMRLQV